ncbi:MAG: hypothetical protein KDE56_20885 [Anaerolineales bacterium]|nr:hypothetical protein [Anaerolineales bacterium]
MAWIYAYAYQQVQDVAVAQDITAVSFEKALSHIGSFSWQGKSVAAWLYRIARNEAGWHGAAGNRNGRFPSPNPYHPAPRPAPTATARPGRADPPFF